MPENGFQLFEFQWRGDAKHASVSVKAAVGYENMAVGVESKEVAEGLDGDDRAGDGFIFGNHMLHENLQRIPGAAAETGKKLSVIQKISAKDLRDAEDEMAVRHFFENIQAEPLAEFHHALLMAGRAEVTALAREGKQIFMVAIIASDSGKAVFKIAAIEITVNHLLDIRPPETILLGKMFIIGLNKGFEIVLDTMIIIRILRMARVI